MKLPCAVDCKQGYSSKTGKDKPGLSRFHITCLWCRVRRKLTFDKFIRYGYLSMEFTRTLAYRVEGDGKLTPVRIITMPTLLRIDPRGHFTMLRCSAIVALDKLALKLGLYNNHLIANLCEFLANYPVV